jgi:hypothetical protein
MDELEDTIGSAKPPRQRKPRDPERSKRVLLQVIAVAAVASAAFTGVTAWETHQDRVHSHAFYCTFASDGGSGEPGKDPGQKLLFKQLGC